jgi:hypothetical protein
MKQLIVPQISNFGAVFVENSGTFKHQGRLNEREGRVSTVDLQEPISSDHSTHIERAWVR